MPGFDDLLRDSLSLPDDDRVYLAEALLASLESDGQPVLSDAWREEIRRRTAEYEAGLVETVPWSEVRQRVRAKYGFHG